MIGDTEGDNKSNIVEKWGTREKLADKEQEKDMAAPPKSKIRTIRLFSRKTSLRGFSFPNIVPILMR